MSGAGLARCSWWNISRAGLGACVAGAYLALLGLQRAHAGTGLVVGAVPWQLVGIRVEEPGYGHNNRVHGAGGRAMGSSVRRSAGR